MSLFARDTERLSRHKLALRHHTPPKNSTPKPYPTSKTQTIIHSRTKHNPIHNLTSTKTLPPLPNTHNNPRKKHPLASPCPIFFPNNVRRNHSPFMNHKAP